MVKRQKMDEFVGLLEFDGRTAEDPEVVAWLADHKARNGSKIRVSMGGKGVRVAFSKEADMAHWKARADQAAAKARKAQAS